MSVRVMSWVWEHSASVGADRLVLLAIADSANDAGRDAYPAMSTIATKANVAKRTAQRSIRTLVALGELSVLENAGPHGTHRYSVLMRLGRRDATRDDLPPVASGQGDDTPPPVVSRHGGVTSDPQKGRRDATRTIHNPPEDKNPSSDAARLDVERICKHLADRIEANGSKRPAVTERWRKSARLLLDVDKRTEEQILRAIDWCQGDEFWRGNVLSLPKLREKYDQLRLAAQRPVGAREAATAARVAARRHDPLGSAR